MLMNVAASSRSARQNPAPANISLTSVTVGKQWEGGGARPRVVSTPGSPRKYQREQNAPRR